MNITPYLFFDGNCAEAFRAYEKCLRGKIIFQMTYGEAPPQDQGAPESKDQIMHMTLQAGETTLQGSDAPPPHYTKPDGFCVSLGVKDEAEAERIFAELAEGGEIRLPMAETFWAKRFGMLVDRFGTPWMINCSKPM